MRGGFGNVCRRLFNPRKWFNSGMGKTPNMNKAKVRAEEQKKLEEPDDLDPEKRKAFEKMYRANKSYRRSLKRRGTKGWRAMLGTQKGAFGCSEWNRKLKAKR